MVQLQLPRAAGLRRRGNKSKSPPGLFDGHLALYDGMASHERVAMLLQVLGGQQRTELPAAAVEAVR